MASENWSYVQDSMETFMIWSQVQHLTNKRHGSETLREPWKNIKYNHALQYKVYNREKFYLS